MDRPPAVARGSRPRPLLGQGIYRFPSSMVKPDKRAVREWADGDPGGSVIHVIIRRRWT
jgi:hypothetical protein